MPLIFYSILLIGFLYFSCNDKNFNIQAEDINYCNYVEFKFMPVAYQTISLDSTTKPSKAYLSDVIVNPKNTDQLSLLVRKYGRFDYIFLNKLFIPNYKEILNLYPDTVLMNQMICDSLKARQNFNKYFAALANLKTDSSQSEETFSWKETMNIASRFFLATRVSDSVISGRVCIAIHGQKELQSLRDYTLLEAFAFEAIFSEKQLPVYIRNFKRGLDSLIQSEKNKYGDFESYFLSVKNKMYSLMEKDPSLKKKLVNYYNVNKENLGFKIL